LQKFSYIVIETCRFQTVESSRAQDKIEIEHLTEMLAKAKEKAERDKEALKKATR